MTWGTFIGMAKATPDNFQFSVKVPETITHQKRLDVKRNALTDFDDLDKISPLKNSNKLGAILVLGKIEVNKTPLIDSNGLLKQPLKI